MIGSFGFLWQEEWEQGLTGSHPWYHRALDPIAIIFLPSDSTVRAEVNNAILTLENSRPAQFLFTDPDTGIDFFAHSDNQVNESIIGVIDLGTTNDEMFFDAFPISVNPETELQIKVKTMSINRELPVPAACSGIAQNGAYQHITIDFNQDFFPGPDIEFTVPGQQFNLADTTGPVFITLGEEARVNIYQFLEARGAVINEPLEVLNIGITQQLFQECDPTVEPQEQIMEVEYIRIVDLPETP